MIFLNDPTVAHAPTIRVNIAMIFRKIRDPLLMVSPYNFLYIENGHRIDMGKKLIAPDRPATASKNGRTHARIVMINT